MFSLYAWNPPISEDMEICPEFVNHFNTATDVIMAARVLVKNGYDVEIIEKDFIEVYQ